MYSTSTVVMERRVNKINKTMKDTRSQYMSFIAKKKDVDDMMKPELQKYKEIEQEIVALKNELARLNRIEKETKRNVLNYKKISDSFRRKADKALLKLKKDNKRSQYLCAINTEMQGRIIDKTAGIDLKAITNALPQDVVKYIGEFLPYSIRFHLIDDRHRPFRLLENMKLGALNAFYCRMVDDPQFLAKIPIDVVNRMINKRFAMRENNFTLFEYVESKLRDILVQHLYFMKIKCPDVAMKFLKILAILVDPWKTYDTSRELLRLV
jgi:hypothetical protein